MHSITRSVKCSRATHVDAGRRWVEFVFSQRRRRRRRESRRRTFVQQETAARQTVLPKIPVNEHGIRYEVISAEYNKSKFKKCNQILNNRSSSLRSELT